LNPLPTLALSTLLLAGPVAQAAEPAPLVDTIHWVTGHLPTVDEGQRSARLNDTLVNFMQAQWPQVQHKMVQASAKRGWQMLAQGEQACLATTVRTPEREAQAYFSNVLLSPPPQLIVRRDKLAGLPLNGNGEIELQRLLADPRWSGALIDGRSYGLFVDNLLSRRSPGDEHVALYSAADFGSKLLPMLALGRADYTIEYELMMSGAPDRERLARSLQNLPIQGASEAVLAGVACPRTSWGLAAITGIDKMLGTPAGATMLRQAQERLMSPESRRYYGARMDVFYRERARPSVIR